MKLKSGFILSKINKKYYAVPVGRLASCHKVLIGMNATCMFVWDKLQQKITEEALLDAITDAYEVSPDLAKQDLTRFLSALRAADLLEE